MSIEIRLTKKEQEIAEWAIDGMQDMVNDNDPENSYLHGDIPIVVPGMMFIHSPYALNDLLYCVEDQYVDMAETARLLSGENVTQDIRYARSLAEKIKHAIEVLSRPFPHMSGMAQEKPKTPAKHWLTVAIFRHLRAVEYCEKTANIYRHGATRCNNDGLEKIAVKLEWLNARFSSRANNHRECAAVLTLLISPPLFQSAIDLKNGGRIDRFVVESGS